jgi:hypothetical protein
MAESHTPGKLSAHPRGVELAGGGEILLGGCGANWGSVKWGGVSGLAVSEILLGVWAGQLGTG